MPWACWKWDRRVRAEGQPELHKELEINWSYVRPCLKNLKKGREDCSVGKDSCHQPWRPEFNPWHPMVEGEHWILQIVIWLPHAWLWCMWDTHTQQINKWNRYFTRTLWLVTLCVFVPMCTCVRIWKPEVDNERLSWSFSNFAETVFHRTLAPPQRSSFIFFFKDLYFYVDVLATCMFVHHTYAVPVKIRTPQSWSYQCLLSTMRVLGPGTSARPTSDLGHGAVSPIQNLLLKRSYFYF